MQALRNFCSASQWLYLDILRKEHFFSKTVNWNPAKMSHRQIFSIKMTLSEKCPYSELFWSAFSRIWTKYDKCGLFSSTGESADKNNSEYGHFLFSVIF